MAAVYVERRKFVATFLAEHPVCQIGLRDCTKVAVDVHEVTRRGRGSALYPGQPGKRPTRYLAACRVCHDYVTFHPDFARAEGFEER